MKSIELHEDNGLHTYLLVMETGDEAFSLITSFAEEQNITAATMTAIGACRRVTLGYFDPDLGDYREREFEEQLEIASCMGDIAMDDGKPALHAHIVLGRHDFSALAGHLQKIEVFPTMEVVITEVPAYLKKKLHRETGLTLIAPDKSHDGKTG